jgi:positive phototaxis protein PixI
MNTLSLETGNYQREKNIGEAFLQIQLNADNWAVLALKNAQEVVTIPAHKITPIPNMNPYILGLLNQRSRVLWVVDIAQMLGLEPLSRKAREYNVTIIKVKNISLALIVKKVQGVIRLDTDLIQSSLSNISPELTPFLRGIFLEKKRVLLVLDAEAIINAST